MVIMLSLNPYCIQILVVVVLAAMKNVTGYPEKDWSWSDDRLDDITERGPFVGGDMILSPEQFQGLNEAISGQYSGIRDPTLRWSNGIVPYKLDPAFNRYEQQIIHNGMTMIQRSTVIRFRPQTSEVSYVYVRKGQAGSGCYSNVGRKKDGVNILNLGPVCIYNGIVAHEFIHAIGFYHEQSRTDRDDYVTVFWKNIEKGKEHNFQKWPKDYVNDYGIPYDYKSIMHYSQHAFSKDGKSATILARTEDPYKLILGQRERLTEYDAQKINAMYGEVVNG